MAKDAVANKGYVTRLIVAIYLLLAAVASAMVLWVAYQTGATPGADVQQMGRIQNHMIATAKDQLGKRLSDLEEKTKLLAGQKFIFETDPIEKRLSIEPILGEMDVDGIFLLQFDENGKEVYKSQAGANRTAAMTEAENQDLLAWAKQVESDKDAAKLDLRESPNARDPQERSTLIFSVPTCTGSGVKRVCKGWISIWVPSYALLKSTMPTTSIVQESYTFAVSWELNDKSGQAVRPRPEILWNSAEPELIRSQNATAKSFSTSIARLIEKQMEGSFDYDIVEMPRRDGKTRLEVVSIQTQVFGTPRWSIGLSSPYELAAERSAAQRNFILMLGFLALGILLVGVALLFYQKAQLDAQAREQRTLDLREVQHNYRELFAENPTAMLVFNADGELIDCNQSAERLTGYSLSESIGRSWRSLFAEEGAETLIDMLKRREQLHHSDKSLKRIKDESPLLVEIWGRRIGDYWIVMAHDVEERRQLEQDKERFKRLEPMGVLASALAHDLNNILGQVQILVSHARTELPLDSDLWSDFSSIEEKIDDASQLVGNLLSFRETVLSPDPVHLEPVLREFSTNLKKVMPESIQIQANIQPGIPSVWIAQTALRRVMDNLCINARDAMPEGGTLTISAYGRRIETQYGSEQLPPDYYAVIEVGDTGMGMSQETKDKIFEPFFSTKPSDKIRGMGLWTVYKIVRKAGGWATVQSKLGKGTTFTIFLRHTSPIDRPGATRDPRISSQIRRPKPNSTVA